MSKNPIKTTNTCKINYAALLKLFRFADIKKGDQYSLLFVDIILSRYVATDRYRIITQEFSDSEIAFWKRSICLTKKFVRAATIEQKTQSLITVRRGETLLVGNATFAEMGIKFSPPAYYKILNNPAPLLVQPINGKFLSELSVVFDMHDGSGINISLNPSDPRAPIMFENKRGMTAYVAPYRT